MDTIIGLGKAGCAIADKFSQYPQYLTYKIDVGLEASPTTHPFTEFQKIEDYEEKCPSFNKFFKDVRGEVLVVIAGGGRLSAASLSVLKYLKNCEINILFIKPDETFLGREARNLLRMGMGVFQEYARSGVFKRLFLIDNNLVEKTLSHVSIKKFL